MKIINKTDYETRYLRKLFLACEKHSFQYFLQHSHPEHRRVTVKYNQKNNVHGYAWYNSCILIITLPHPVSIHLKTIKTENKVSARTVAKVYLHELAHNLGKRHKNMCSTALHCQFDISWWPDELVPLKVVKEKPKQNIIESRAAKAQKKLEEWQTKTRRANKLVKKYQRQVKYYEKKMAACKEVEKCKSEQS